MALMMVFQYCLDLSEKVWVEFFPISENTICRVKLRFGEYRLSFTVKIVVPVGLDYDLYWTTKAILIDRLKSTN